MRTVITDNDAEYGPLFSTSNCRLVHDTAHNLAINNDQPSVVGGQVVCRWTDSGVAFGIRLLLLVTPRFDVHFHLGLFVGLHEDIEDLLARP